MAEGESQDCSWVARGWVRRLFFVLFSYACKAALKTDWKLEEGGEEDEEDAIGGTWDIVTQAVRPVRSNLVWYLNRRPRDRRDFVPARAGAGRLSFDASSVRYSM